MYELMIMHGDILRSLRRSNNSQFSNASLNFALKKPTNFMDEIYYLVLPWTRQPR